MSEKSAAPEAASTDVKSLRSNVMGPGGLAFTVIAMVGPMAAFMGASPLVFTLSGAGTSGVYLLATALFLLFAVGYLAMVRRMRNASGFITFIASGLGKRAGIAASYVTLVTYTAFLAGLYGIYAIFVQQALIAFLGIDVHWGILAIVLIAINAVLSYNRVEFSLRIMGVLLVVAVVAILVLDVAVLAQGGADESFSFVGFTPTAVFGTGFGLAALFALGSFGGVENTAVFSEEVRNPRTTVARAMYISILVLGAFYVFSTWVIANGVGVGRILEVANEDPTGFIFTVAGTYVGPVWVQVLNVLVVTSFFAVLLGFTNVMSRYVFALGRAGILPAAIGRTHPKHQSPHIGSIVTAVLMVVIVGIFILAGADPIGQLYTWFFAIGSFGVLLLMCLSSLSVVLYFRRHKDAESTTWKTVIAPVIAFLALGAAICFAVANFNVIAGGDGIIAWLWAIIPLAALVGLAVSAIGRYQSVDLDGIE